MVSSRGILIQETLDPKMLGNYDTEARKFPSFSAFLRFLSCPVFPSRRNAPTLPTVTGLDFLKT
jgi:hypothetical protein